MSSHPTFFQEKRCYVCGGILKNYAFTQKLSDQREVLCCKFCKIAYLPNLECLRECKVKTIE